MFEQIILGIIQGIAEWLPVSSEGVLVLVKTHVFASTRDVTELIAQALFLHLGTFFAALIYFHKDVVLILKGLLNFKSQSDESRKTISFLFVTTLISGILGLGLIYLLSGLSAEFDTHGKLITLFIGCLLLGTGFLDLRANRRASNIEFNKSAVNRKIKTIKDLRIMDAVIMGFVQGCAALPGFSRSGLTVSALLLLKFDKTHALKLSFLMSLPIVLAGNIVLNFFHLQWSPASMLGLLFSFLFGLATIHILLKLAQKIKFGYFIIGFGLLTLLSAII